MLLGTYEHNMDAKGRVSIPAKFRDDLGSTFVISYGLDHCLYVYSMEEWTKFADEINAGKGTNALKIKRFFMSNACECEIDSQGRALIPQSFKIYANLTKEVTIIGVSTRAEIWNREDWNSFKADNDLSTENIGEYMNELGMML
ncbi:MAG: division/cell wall cluster transcriptional repressor MraZ [Clostridia bacterium]|nr:division/cell wall cluster transcriptional repressor MraZ [Clostridia bacterium]